MSVNFTNTLLLGYARISTADQNPDHQVDALRRAGGDVGDRNCAHAPVTRYVAPP